jgi:hypothetical protein
MKHDVTIFTASDLANRHAIAEAFVSLMRLQDPPASESLVVRQSHG